MRTLQLNLRQSASCGAAEDGGKGGRGGGGLRQSATTDVIAGEANRITDKMMRKHSAEETSAKCYTFSFLSHLHARVLQ